MSIKAIQSLSEQFFCAADHMEKKGDQVRSDVYRKIQVLLDELTTVDDLDQILPLCSFSANAFFTEKLLKQETEDSHSEEDPMTTLYNIYDSLCLLAEGDFGLGDPKTMQQILAYLRTIVLPMQAALAELAAREFESKSKN